VGKRNFFDNFPVALEDPTSFTILMERSFPPLAELAAAPMAPDRDLPVATVRSRYLPVPSFFPQFELRSALEAIIDEAIAAVGARSHECATL